MKNPYRQGLFRVGWSRGHSDRCAGRPLADRSSWSQSARAGYLRGYLGGKPGPFPARYANTWRELGPDAIRARKSLQSIESYP